MKPVLIIENSRNGLKLNENTTSIKNDYILSGIFTEFDVVNRNERIYTADEYVPHVERMMEKKQWGVIYGEYDHPDVFDVSMKYVSHVVENAFYNKEHNRVDGEIRLLNTHYGKDAKALVDDGLPLFVSSRAAGITESNGRVKLKQLFTYDIVADPGFASAKMQVKSMNESLGFTEKDNSFLLVESTKHQLSDLATKYEKSSDRHIFDLSDESKTNDLFNMNKNDLVTKNQLSEWSRHLTSEIRKNNAQIMNSIKESKNAPVADNSLEDLIKYQEELEAQFEKVVTYLDYLAEKITYSINATEVLEKKTDDIVNFSNYLAENLDKAIDYSNYLAEQLDNSIDYSNYLAEGLDKAIDYSNYLAENLDKAIDYSEYIAESLTNSIKYSNYLAENLDKAIDYTEYIAENLDANIGYTSYIAENLDVNIGYVQYVAENLETSISYADYLSECLDIAMDYSTTIAESINKSASEGTLITEKLATADEFLSKLVTETSTKEEDKTEEECDTTMTSKEEEEKVEAKKKVKDMKSKKDEESTKEEEENIINTSETNTPSEEITAEQVNVEENNTNSTITNDSNETLSEKVEKLIAEAKKREASKVVKPNFYEFLTADDVKTFESLSNEEQENIKVAINESSTGYYSRHDVLSLMKQVLEKSKPSAEQLLLDGMPTDIIPLWEKVDTKMKQSIMSQARFYDTSSATLVEHFWNTRNFDFVNNENKKLLESNNPFEKLNKLSENEIDYFTDRFKRLN